MADALMSYNVEEINDIFDPFKPIVDVQSISSNEKSIYTTLLDDLKDHYR